MFLKDAKLQTFFSQSAARTVACLKVTQAQKAPVIWAQRLALIDVVSDGDGGAKANAWAPVNVGKFQELIAAGASASTALREAMKTATGSKDLEGRQLSAVLANQVALERAGAEAVANANAKGTMLAEVAPYKGALNNEFARYYFLRRAVGVSEADALRISKSTTTSGALPGTKGSSSSMKRQIANTAALAISRAPRGVRSTPGVYKLKP
ncbi:MAG: hypothetical protein AAB262_00865, partial [Elusimicrobiota bacterium]